MEIMALQVCLKRIHSNKNSPCQIINDLLINPQEKCHYKRLTFNFIN
jgi:hypothetical protein